MIFAQAAQSAPAMAGPGINEIWAVIIGVGAIASIFGNIAQWVMSRRKRERVSIDNQPIEVQEATMFAREKECRERHDSLQDQIVEMRNNRIIDAKDGAQSRRQLHEEVRNVRGEMTAMERRLDQKSEERTNRLQDLLNEVLQETGRLGGKVGGGK